MGLGPPLATSSREGNYDYEATPTHGPNGQRNASETSTANSSGRESWGRSSLPPELGLGFGVWGLGLGAWGLGLGAWGLGFKVRV